MYEDYFLKSLNLTDNFEIFTKCGIQHSQSGNYFSEGFNETTKEKIKFLLDTLNTSVEENEIILFSDVDIIFISKTEEFFNKFKEFDMVFQNGVGGLNTGFFLVKNNNQVKKLLKEVIDKCHIFDNDQIALNFLIKNHPIKFTMFGDEIFSVAHVIGPKVWNGEKFEIPNNILVFHACWCAGVNKKIELLNYVRENTNFKTN
jgi:predicted oxidoreductase